MRFEIYSVRKLSSHKELRFGNLIFTSRLLLSIHSFSMPDVVFDNFTYSVTFASSSVILKAGGEFIDFRDPPLARGTERSDI